MNPEVAYISTTPHLTTWNNLARTHMEANSVESYFFTGLNGRQRVAVADTGIDHDHGDFGNRIVQRIDVANDGSRLTPTTGTGRTSHAPSWAREAGPAPTRASHHRPSCTCRPWRTTTREPLGARGLLLLNSAYGSGGARIHTNSWGAELCPRGYYSTQSEDADDRTSTWDQYWTYDGMTVLFAAGNERDDACPLPGRRRT